MGHERHVAVIGAGVAGVTTCHGLLERGFRVTLIDRQRYAGMETSFANGGQLSASNAEVWNRTAIILKGLRWMIRRDAPLLVNPKPSWHKASWMLGFMAAIVRYEANTIETVRLAIAARQHLLRLAEREGIAFDFEERGILPIYESEAEYRHAERVNALLARGGLVRRGAAFRASTNIERLAVRRQGVSLAMSENGGRSDEETFDAVVICAGVGSRGLAHQAGDRVNVYPVKGYSITVPLVDDASQAAAPWVSILDDQTKIVASRLGASRFRVAGTAGSNGFDRDIRDDRIRPLVRRVERYFPGIDTSACIPWAGLRPMMPDMVPRVGAGTSPRVFYNTGHGHLGWTLSPATAELVGEAVSNGMRAA